MLNKKIHNSLLSLSKENRNKPKKIKTLACIVDPKLSISVDNFIDLSHSINLQEKDLKIITFQENRNSFNVFSSMNITPSCVTYFGNLDGKDSLEFISFEYDMLINFFKSNKFLTLLSSKTKANFRVGFDSVNSDLNDLIFSEKLKKYSEFKYELIKYLKMIK